MANKNKRRPNYEELNNEDLEKIAGGKGDTGKEKSSNRHYVCNGVTAMGTRLTINTSINGKTQSQDTVIPS
ncbi:MAG: ComC/BlpC family leader-containing pheromone/bacteriocin [Desulfobacterales bacterium]|nr:ComC/BlpC family leader-containing pheromone/bacteriocin [Desulfobacterales bacterium]